MNTIAFLIDRLEVKGGTHKQLLKLVEYVASLDIDFIIVTKGVDFEKTYPGFLKFKSKIILVPEATTTNSFVKKIDNYKAYVCRLRVAVQNVDIVNIHDNGFEMHLEAFKGKDVYWQINDLQYSFVKMHNATPISWMDRIKLFIIRRKIIHGLKYIKGISVNVSKNKEKVKKYLSRDAEVFYCGIESINIKRDNAESYDRFSNKTINLLSSGVFFSYRNYETQVLVVKELLKRGYNTHLNIIGSTELSPDYVANIQDLIAVNNLKENISICGQVDEVIFESLHRSSDIFLFVNVNQSWGLAVFEAMSCGLPVIVSDSVGATEILSDGTDSLFVDPFNVDQIVEEVISLVESRSKYQNISDNALKIVDQYTWDKAYSSKMLNFMLNQNAKHS